jgi:membrane associated rhomboid family serine protease
MSQWRNSLARGGKVTKTLIGINVLVYLIQFTSNDAVTPLLALYPPAVVSMPWTIITSGFAHASILHILLNMYSLWIFGEALEGLLGAKRFFWLYFLSILGGSIAFIIFNPLSSAVGASGGIFGLMGAYFIITRAMGYRSSQMLMLILINIAIGIFSPGIAMSAHLGGLAVGASIAWYYTKNRK